MSALYLCPVCCESPRLDRSGRLVPHPSRRAPRMDCMGSRRKPKTLEVLR